MASTGSASPGSLDFHLRGAAQAGARQGSAQASGSPSRHSPSWMVKLCSRARPSNQWLYLLSPTECIPGPLRSRVPRSQVGILPGRRKEA